MQNEKMKRFIGVILFLVIFGAITDWLKWREPEWESRYDSSLLSRGEVLDIAEQLLVHQIKQDIGSTRDTSKGYHIKLFNGQFESDFYDRFDGRGFPPIIRKLRGGSSNRRKIYIIRFEQINMGRLIVVFSQEDRNTIKKMFKAVFEKRNGQWHYLQT